MTVERHGRLTLLAGDVGRTADGHKLGLWRCDCGAEARVAMSRVRNGYTQSCGCLSHDTAPNLKHGKRNSPEYSSWQAMLGRCLNRNAKDYRRYGARGVSVAVEWQNSFEAFYAHVGPRPHGTTLDRIDTLRGYEPGNVRWATPTQQAENTRANWLVEIDGVQYPSVEEAARQHGVSNITVVRWCEGYVDRRRTHTASGGIIAPRANCRRWKKYAA